MQLSRKRLWGPGGDQVDHEPATYPRKNFTVESYTSQESSWALLNLPEER